MQIYSPINNPLISYQFPEIKEIFAKGLDPIDYYNRYLVFDRYRLKCMEWLSSGKNTKIKGLVNFPFCYAINGVGQYISDLPKIENRTIVMHNKEYGGYKKILGLYNHPHRLEETYSDLDKNSKDEVIVLSYPVSLNGNKDKTAEDLIKNSKTPIILDSVFLGTNLFDITIDLSNVETFVFSFSKSFGMSYNRIGILFTRNKIPEYELYHEHGYLNLYAMQIAMRIMNSYNIDYFTNKYKEVYQEACKIKNLEMGDCILVGKNSTSDADKKGLVTDIFDELIKNVLHKD